MLNETRSARRRKPRRGSDDVPAIATTSVPLTSTPTSPQSPARRCSVEVVGLGNVGLPQALAFARAGHPVDGIDIDPNVRAGRSHLDTVGHADLAQVRTMLSVPESVAALRYCAAVLICVPTRLDEHGAPDLAPLLSATRTVAGQLTAGQLIVVESTVYPGVVEQMVCALLEKTGLRGGLDFHLAHVPERIDPGNFSYAADNTPRVVGGLTDECAQRAVDLYTR